MAVAACRAAGRFGLDTETTSIDPTRGHLVGLSLAWAPNEGLYVPLAHLKPPTADTEGSLPGLLPDSGLPDLTRELAADATAAGVKITSISAGSPVTAGGTSAPGQLTSAAGHLFAIPVTLAVEGGLSQERVLLQRLQNGTRRALLVSAQFSGSGASAGSMMDLSVQLKVFTAPQTPAAEAALEKQLGTTSAS